MKKKTSHRGKKFLKKARARAYKNYYLWLTQHKNIRQDLETPRVKFKKVR